MRIKNERRKKRTSSHLRVVFTRANLLRVVCNIERKLAVSRVNELYDATNTVYVVLVWATFPEQKKNLFVKGSSLRCLFAF